ncbi:hypothetical protein D3C81_1589680 [compost metagenome]
MLGTDGVGQVAPEQQRGVARFGGVLQIQFDTPPLATTFDFDDLLAHAAYPDRDRLLPVAFLK